MDARKILDLRSLSIFGDVPGPVLSGASALLQDRAYSKGESVQARDAVVPAILFLRDGIVHVDRDQGAVELAAPAHLGLYFALSGSASSASVTAQTALQALALDVRDLFDLFEDHFPLLRSAIREIARTVIRDTDGKLAAPFAFARSRPSAVGDKIEFDLVDRLFFLRRMLSFPHVSVDALASVARQLRMRTFAPGQTIWKRGDPAIDMTIIVRGTVEGKSDVETIVHDGGGPLGGLEVFAQAARWFDLTAKTETLVFQTSYDAILDMFEEHIEMGIDVVSSLARTVLEVDQKRGDLDAKMMTDAGASGTDTAPA